MAAGRTITPGRFHALVDQARSAERWLDLPAPALHEHYNRRGFLVSHRLGEHPLLQLDALARLALRMPADAVRHRFGIVPIDTHFDHSLARGQSPLTLQDALERLEQERAYIAIYNPERDPEYRPVIEGLIGEIGLAMRDIEPLFNWFSTYIFISANESLTPYHMDREMNFLMQVRGRKTVKLWDPLDPAVMTPAQRDYLFTYADDSRAPWREELRPLASSFELRPGVGVHHPFIAPHSVRTESDVSISLALTFRTPRSDIWTDAHQFNHRFRKLGLGAVPVRRVDAVDTAKAGLIRAIRAVKAGVRGRRQGPVDAADAAS